MFPWGMQGGCHRPAILTKSKRWWHINSPPATCSHRHSKVNDSLTAHMLDYHARTMCMAQHEQEGNVASIHYLRALFTGKCRCKQLEWPSARTQPLIISRLDMCWPYVICSSAPQPQQRCIHAKAKHRLSSTSCGLAKSGSGIELQ